MTRGSGLCAIALALAACGGMSGPPPHVQRTCTESQTREALDCKQFDFELRLTEKRDYQSPEVQSLFHDPSRTECGCLRNLAATVDAAANQRIRSEVLDGCRCIHGR